MDKDIELSPTASGQAVNAPYASVSQNDVHQASLVNNPPAPPLTVPTTIFSDSTGNLKFVNIIVDHSLKFLFFVFAVCILVTFLLFSVVFATGNPITPDTYTYDINDVRSVAFDSFTLASEEIKERWITFFGGLQGYMSDSSNPLAAAYMDMASPSSNQSYFFEASDSGSSTLYLSEQDDLTYWIYEAETASGVFTPAGLAVMDDAESMFTSQPDWEEWCLRDYLDLQDADKGFNCTKPLSALNAFKARNWDQTKVLDIEGRLDNPVPGIPILPSAVLDALGLNAFNGREVYQLLGFCSKFGLGCDVLDSLQFSAIFSSSDVDTMKAFATQLDVDFEAVTELWDGTGPINDTPDDVTLLCAYMKEAYKIDFFFDKFFSKENPISKYSRSITLWGGPILPRNIATSERVNTENEDSIEKANEDGRKKYVMDKNRGLFKKMENIADTSHSSALNAYYFMRVLILDVFLQILANDGMFAAISITIVYLYMRFMIGSWFLANVGFCEIVLSIPMAWFFAETIFQVDYFSSLNPLCLFIVAAIGADDIFVFMDAYKQSAFKGAKLNRDLKTRLSYVYRRAGTAMLITSATTCSAFLCTVASPIASTKSFGIFAALVILMDYILVMSMFCTAVVIYHDYFENPRVSCCAHCVCQCCCPCVPVIAPDERSTAKARAGKNDDVRQDRITEFYKGPFTDFVLDPVKRFSSMAVLFCWLCVAFYFMLQLEPTKKSEEFLDDEHPLQKAITILNEGFPVASDDRGAKMYFIWGVDDVNREGVNQMIKDDYIGKPTFDDSFVLTPACQEKIDSYVQAVRLDVDGKYDPYVKNTASGLAVVSWLDEFKDWINGGGSSLFEDCVRNPQKQGYTFPVGADDIGEAIARFAYEPSCSDDKPYPGALMIETYSDMSRGTGLLGTPFGFDGENLKVSAISLESSVLDPWSEIAETKAMEQYTFFMAEANVIDNLMAADCGPVMMTDIDQKYVIMNNQKIFRTSAVSGAMIGCVIAFFVILISTYNFFVAAFATFSILCVLISVVGAVTMAGWTLGTITAILISILAGFSVDYVVHLAHAFCETPGDKETRVKGAFADMGVSVMSGMLTSILASLPLFLCRIKFFASFGIFLCATIGFSWIFANIMFMGLLATFDIMKYSYRRSEVKTEASV